jgi:Cu+-exporting ATPase
MSISCTSCVRAEMDMQLARDLAESPAHADARDPVCGMTVPADAPDRRDHDGKTYLFCSSRCAAKFTASPEDYLGDQPRPAPPASADAIYTCPMHPEIEQVGPGDCPICGMALEPKEVTLDEGPSEELIDMTRRFWIAAALSLPLLIWVMSDHLLGLDLGHAIPRQLAQWIQLAIATPVVLWAGWPVFKRCWASFRAKSANMWTLIGIGVGAAYLYSVVATLVPGIFPAAFRGPEGQVDVYFAMVQTQSRAGRVRRHCNRLGGLPDGRRALGGIFDQQGTRSGGRGARRGRSQ